jgi:hypothetical protein
LQSLRALRTRAHTMSLFGLLLVGSFAACFGLAVALAFARAVLYANVLTELDRAHGLPRGLYPARARSAQRAGSGNEDADEPAPIRPGAARILVRPVVSRGISRA